MASQVRIEYEAVGAREASVAVQELALATLEHARALETSEDKVAEYDRAIGEARRTLEAMRASQQQTTAATQAQAQGWEQLAQRGVMLATRFAGITSAAGSLLTRLGDAEGGRAAGLAASVAQNITQFAALGSMLGPGGAVIGALAGAANAIISIADESRTAAEETAALRHELEGLADARLAERDRAAFDEEVRTRTIGEGRSTSMLEREREVARIEGERALEAAHEHSDLVERTRAMYESAGRAVPEGVVESLNRESGAIRENIAALREREDALREELQRRADLEAIGPGRVIERPRGHRRPSSAEEPVDEGAFLERMGVEAEAAAIEREAQKIEDRAAERAEFERAAAAAATEEAIKAAEERNEAEERRHQHELDRIANERRARENLDRANMERLAEQTQMLEAVGDRIGGVFASAFASAIQGQEDFGTALAKGTKAALIQFGTTMVAEGIGALLTAAGNVVINPPAAATKAVEGAGKIALGVGLGAAGAAIPTGGGAAPTQRAERPRVDQPQGQGAGAGGPMVIQVNAPTVMGGTHLEVGRYFGELAVDGARRFGGGR